MVPPPESIPARDVLKSWREIAQYLGISVRTVQRWEQRCGLPVQRPLGVGRKGEVIALRDELNRWMAESWSVRGEEQEALADRVRALVAAQQESCHLFRELRSRFHSMRRYRAELRDILLKTEAELARLAYLLAHPPIAARQQSDDGATPILRDDEQRRLQFPQA